MSGPGEFSAEEDSTSTTTSMKISTALNEIDLTKLSERGKAIKLTIVDEMNDGYDLATIARELGQTPSWVSDRLAELRHEVELQSGTFFPLTDQEFQALKLSIETYGVQSPILVGDHSLLDGRHRWLASKELGLTTIPAVFLSGLTTVQERELGIAVNAARRQLTSKQKHALVRSELLIDASRADRRIAAICGVTHPTVASIREELIREQTSAPSQDEVDEVGEEIRKRLRPEKRITATGNEYSVPERSEPKEKVDFLGYVVCTHGEVHRLVRRDGEYGLETDRD